LKNQSNSLPLKTLLLPHKFFFFITNDIYNRKLRVKINERVLRGQPLIFGDRVNPPIHAPTSGWIKDISFDLDPINQRKQNIKIIISPDYLDQWIRLKPIANYKKQTIEKLIQIIYQSGVVGLGGSQFSSAQKLKLSINKVHTLIVNAVESEPNSTSDNFLINNYIPEILKGCEIICWITKIKIVLIVIQEHNIEEISKIYDSIKYQSLFKVCIIKNKYPGGSSKILIKSLTGKEIPYGKHAIDIGYLIFNIATIYAIKRAIVNGEPLTERIITCLGNNNILSGNFWIRIGTPIKYFLLDKKENQLKNIIICLRGFFMGEKIHNFNYSILKNTNCISIDYKKEQENKNINEYTCIRCSYCADVCPINLLPQQLYWYSKKNNHKETERHHILDCIECKACEKVCPSYIPLVSYFKKEKQILNEINIESNFKKISFINFQMKEKRLLNQRKNVNKFKINNKKIDLSQKNIRQQMLKEAIKRIKDKK